MATSLFDFGPVEPWCYNLLHHWWYGDTRRVKEKTERFEDVEYFCNKCGKKTGGYWHFGPYEIPINL